MELPVVKITELNSIAAVFVSYVETSQATLVPSESDVGYKRSGAQDCGPGRRTKRGLLVLR